MPLSSDERYILLADDDKDDCDLFRDALRELHFSPELGIVRNGEQLMQLLSGVKVPLPDILFLDVNMPRKNGFECLSELKQINKLKDIPVVIFSTSNDPQLIGLFYVAGAQYYLRKPNNYEQLKEVIHLALTLSEQTAIFQPSRENFVLAFQPVNDGTNKENSQNFPTK